MDVLLYYCIFHALFLYHWIFDSTIQLLNSRFTHVRTLWFPAAWHLHHLEGRHLAVTGEYHHNYSTLSCCDVILLLSSFFLWGHNQQEIIDFIKYYTLCLSSNNIIGPSGALTDCDSFVNTKMDTFTAHTLCGKGSEEVKFEFILYSMSR